MSKDDLSAVPSEQGASCEVRGTALGRRLIEEFERRAKRDHALATTQSGVVGFGVTASFAACWSEAADVVREFMK